MPHSEVTEIELKDDGTLVLSVEIFGFEAGEQIEVSGSAAQANGALATFYTIQKLAAAGKSGGSPVTVTATPTGTFVEKDVITVVGRAAKIWGTVLSGDPSAHIPGVKAVWKAEPQT
jgi:hypothetical protein